MKTNNMKKKDWLGDEFGDQYNAHEYKAVSMYFQLNCVIHLENID